MRVTQNINGKENNSVCMKLEKNQNECPGKYKMYVFIVREEYILLEIFYFGFANIFENFAIDKIQKYKITKV